MWLKLLRSPVTCIFLKDSDDKLRALYGYMYDMRWLDGYGYNIT